MSQIRRITTIKQQVYEILRDDICSGVYAPGQQIQETELSKKLEISRSPIREALRQLPVETGGQIFHGQAVAPGQHGGEQGRAVQL